jgi:UDP-N-acetyl-D-mannosaminuronate dehydrogenase
VLTLLLQNKDAMETIKYCEFAKMNSGTIREINIAVSKEAFIISEKVKN